MSNVDSIAEFLGVGPEEATKIHEKAVAGGEIGPHLSESEWFEKRFQPNCVFIDETGYSRMCIDALKIVSNVAAHDFGGTRQRDLGQLWADMTRGYLGELAFQIFLQEKWGVTTDLGHEEGELGDFLPMDIHSVIDSEGKSRPPGLHISVKTTKWNGIWLDIPGDQFAHSEIHSLVKVGVGRDHLFAFFKSLSVFKDKVLKKGQEIGVLTSSEADDLYDRLPSFGRIPAYICGFADRNQDYPEMAYGGKRGRMHYMVKSWCGPILSGDLTRLKEREGITGEVKFEGIGKFAHDNGYLFNTGSLEWSRDAWAKVLARL